MPAEKATAPIASHRPARRPTNKKADPIWDRLFRDAMDAISLRPCRQE